MFRALARFVGLEVQQPVVSAEDKYKQYVKQLEEEKKLARQTEERQRKEQQALLKIPAVVKEHQEVQRKLYNMAAYEIELQETTQDVVAWADACMSGDTYALAQEITESDIKRRLYTAKAEITGQASQPNPQVDVLHQQNQQLALALQKMEERLENLAAENEQYKKDMANLNKAHKEAVEELKKRPANPPAQPQPPVNTCQPAQAPKLPAITPAPAPSASLPLPVNAAPLPTVKSQGNTIN